MGKKPSNNRKGSEAPMSFLEMLEIAGVSSSDIVFIGPDGEIEAVLSEEEVMRREAYN